MGWKAIINPVGALLDSSPVGRYLDPIGHLTKDTAVGKVLNPVDAFTREKASAKPEEAPATPSAVDEANKLAARRRGLAIGQTGTSSGLVIGT
jgi:hypothetical protein